MDTSFTYGLKGGHAESKGLTASGEVIEIGEHRHEVEIDLTRYELGISRTFGKNWDATLRVPYLIKDQVAHSNFESDASHDERAAAQRNSEIHHRTETYEGFGDGEFVIGWRQRDVFGEGSVLRIGLGFSIPIGDTEDDPWALGDAGKRHLHIQMGNGTFDPLLETYLGLPLSQHFAFSLFAKARVPFYESSKGYRGPPQVTVSPRITWLPTKNLSVTAGVLGDYLGHAEWPSGRDRGTGQYSFSSTISVGYKFNENVSASFSAIFPFHSRTLVDEDTLDPAPTFSLSVGISF